MHNRRISNIPGGGTARYYSSKFDLVKMEHLTLCSTEAGEVELLTTKLFNVYIVNCYIPAVNVQNTEVLESKLLPLVDREIWKGISTST